MRVQADGAFDFAVAGADLYHDGNCYAYMWRRAKGDFTVTAKMTYIGGDRVNGVKGGLMVRSSLASGAPFYSIVMRRNTWDFACCRRIAWGEWIYQPATVNGDSAWNVHGASTVWLKMTRRGDTFKCYWRASEFHQWTLLYSYDAPDDLYGETVYVGPAATFVSTASTSSDYANARYAWRFSSVSVQETRPFCIFLR